MEELLRVGVITSAHGICGEVNVFPTTDDPSQFTEWKTLQLVNRNGQTEIGLQSAKFFKQMVILKLKGIEDRDAAERLKQSELYILRSQARVLEENENFISDLIGIRTVNEDGELLGTCTDVLQTGANDVYVIQLENGKEVLFPAIPQCILKVDTAAGVMTVHVMDGLMD